MLFFISLISYAQILSDSEILKLRHKLSIKFKGDSQIEVGGPYAGLEFHHGSPLPQRISFYYPVANSIDNSTDYWYRDTTHIMDVKLKINDGIFEEIGNESWEYNLTPYRVDFVKNDSVKKINISYEFCKNSHALVIKYSFKNISNSRIKFTLGTSLTTALRTSHTYNTQQADSFYSFNQNESYRYIFDNIETKFTNLFVLNSGEKPLKQKSQNNDAYLKTASFMYENTIKSKDSMIVIQIIGCTTSEDFEKVTTYLANNYENELREYESEILNESFNIGKFGSGNENIDFTFNWAKAVMYSNRHYIDNDIVPMPCPAEYNFFFTHDVLVTDLAVVLYDLGKVKKDLLFLEKHKNSDNILPHAYYWKDSSFATEYSEIDNWNHLWFIILCGKYLRHSGDDQLMNLLYPIINKSVEITLNNKQPDDLMWASRPDGWDIGSSYGPRTFMTVLAIQAFKEFIYISNSLQKNMDKLEYFGQLTTKMNEQLTTKLWSDELNYLINYYEDGSQDKHYYAGSLLAAHFRLLNSDKSLKMMNSAQQKLLDEKLGIYNVFPMDFHLLKEYLKFEGNEVGAPFYYANGGVWPHANAWFALGLINSGLKNEAYDFIQTIMTMDGVLNSPNGQPAMYEYRISDKNNLEVYGKIDKPQFLWAGGWYIYSLYNLFGVKENNWNISFEPFLPSDIDSVNLNLTLSGNLIPTTIKGRGKYISSILYNNEVLPSYVIPAEVENNANISIELGELKIPMILNSESKIIKTEYSIESKTLSVLTKSYFGNKVKINFISPISLISILIDRKEMKDYKMIKQLDGNFNVYVEFMQSSDGNNLELKFN